MENWVIKTWLPLLLLVLAVAGYFEFSSVKKIDLDSGYGALTVSETQVSQSPQRDRPTERDEPKRVSHLVAGARYASLDELVTDQQIAGYVRTGYFGKFWPATVTEIATDKDGIRFVRENGTRHNYTKFDGYRMKMVRLNDGRERETIVVFRSLEKR